MTHQEKVARWIRPGWIGCEIGPGDAPIPGFSPRPIYIDRFKEFGRAACTADYYGDACQLPFHSNSLDYVASSHVLEHVANPVAALAEWYRVLRPGGIIYLVVPNRLATWDHTRPLTPVEHLLDDYVHGTTNCDATHIDEFVYEIDRSRYHESNTSGESLPDREILARGMHEAVARGEEINVHFHTFEPHTLRELIHTLRRWPVRRFNWELLDEVDGFPSATPSGVLAVIRVLKGWRDRAQADAFDVTAGTDRRTAVMRPDARSFAEPASIGV
jgi:SAM-dependent methyltransferase